jgi:sulfur carrier protein ThiS
MAPTAKIGTEVPVDGGRACPAPRRRGIMPGMKLRLAICGRNYDAAAGLPAELPLPEGATLDDALAAVGRLLPPGRQLPESCLVALGGAHLGTLGRHAQAALRDGDELLLLLPVAGG